MLKNLKLYGFKSILKSELSFGRINLFIGPNGAGKSNILEAIGFLSASLSRGLDPLILDSKGVRLSLPALFKSAFRNQRVPAQFRLEAEFEHGKYQCSIRINEKRSRLEFHSEALYQGTTRIFGRGPNGISLNATFVHIDKDQLGDIEPSRGIWDIIRPISDISDEFLMELKQMAEYSIYSPQTAVMRGTAIDSRPVEPLGLTGSGLAAAFNDVIANTNNLPAEDKQAYMRVLSLIWAPGWADQIRVGTLDTSIVPKSVKSDGLLMYIRDIYMKTNRNYLSAFDASEGTLYLIFVVTLLLNKYTPKTFALDNVDGTLNPKLVRKLTDILVEACISKANSPETYAYQSFVTSHHPSSLDSFDLFSKNERIFITQRDLQSSARGGTVFVPMLPPEKIDKEEWIDRMDGRSLSALLLDNMIDGAL